MEAKRSNKIHRRALPLVKKITWRPLGGLLGPAVTDASQSLVAIAFAAIVSTLTGLGLALATDTLEQNGGLLLLFPAAIGLRGNVFGPFASRMSTAMRAGTFSWTTKRDSVLGQNIVAVIATSFAASVAVGIVAKLVAELVITDGSVMSMSAFVTVSVVSATLATFLLFGITIGLAFASTRFDWDLDNVTAPVVTAAGDLVTLPALLLGVLVLGRGLATQMLNVFGLIICVLAVALVWLTKGKIAKRVFLESMPMLVVAGLVSLLAGLVIEGSKDDFLTYPVMLILIPGYLTVAGSLGGILSNRLSTKIHLGLIQSSAIPTGDARKDISIIFRLALPIFFGLALVGQLVAKLFDQGSPGLGWLLLVTMTGGLVASIFVIFVAYYGTFAVVRFGLDPDNHGIPLVSASLDLIGSSTLLLALILWGVV